MKGKLYANREIMIIMIKMKNIQWNYKICQLASNVQSVHIQHALCCDINIFR